MFIASSTVATGPKSVAILSPEFWQQQGTIESQRVTYKKVQLYYFVNGIHCSQILTIIFAVKYFSLEVMILLKKQNALLNLVE